MGIRRLALAVATPFQPYPVQISVGVGTVPALGVDYGTAANADSAA